MKKHLIYMMIGFALALTVSALIVLSRGSSEIFIYNNF
jgi:hypothetical protein